MLSSKQRLRAQEVRAIISTGRSARAQFISLKYLPTSPMLSLRAAVVISKKIAKDAVLRNRIRRQVYAALKQVEHIPMRGVFFVNTLPCEPRLPVFIKDILKVCLPQS